MVQMLKTGLKRKKQEMTESHSSHALKCFFLVIGLILYNIPHQREMRQNRAITADLIVSGKLLAFLLLFISLESASQMLAFI